MAGGQSRDVARAHLLFTSAVNLAGPGTEPRRVRRPLRSVDLVVAGGPAVDGLLIATARPLSGVLTVGPAARIALAALLMEPATSAATCPE